MSLKRLKVTINYLTKLSKKCFSKRVFEVQLCVHAQRGMLFKVKLYHCMVLDIS